MVTRIVIYDFDHTLFRSPTPPKWWTGKSWWRSPQSLLPPCVPEKPSKEWWNQSLVAKAKKDSTDPNTFSILASGRWSKPFALRVKELVRQQGLKFDLITLPTTPGSQPFKRAIADRLMKDFPGVQQIQVYDDHPPHSKAYKIAAQKMGVPFRINDIDIEPKKARCPDKVENTMRRHSLLENTSRLQDMSSRIREVGKQILKKLNPSFRKKSGRRLVKISKAMDNRDMKRALGLIADLSDQERSLLPGDVHHTLRNHRAEWDLPGVTDDV